SDDGRLAAATSTGGILAQYPGRLGDTPVPGAGTWCDERHALSGTGIGEAFLRSVACRSVALRIDLGASPEEALRTGLDDLVKARGDGGFIYLGADGTFGFAYNTPMLPVCGPTTPRASSESISLPARAWPTERRRCRRDTLAWPSLMTSSAAAR